MARLGFIRLAAAALAMVGLAACSGPSPIQDVEGSQVYTQLSMWADGDKHLTTNYSVGVHVPVNTQVNILSTSAETITIQIPEPDNREVTIINAAQHTQEDIQGIYDRYFGSQPVNLNRFSGSTRDAIQAGEVREGMSKDAVLLARGYPPAHRTASTEADEWMYWRNRFNRVAVRFENGEVSEIQD
jgi:hypothetical protein